jgi:hypothetical protein
MEIKSFTYERSWYGTYYRQRLFSVEKMDNHIVRMLEAGWEILMHTAHSGLGRGIRPFARRDAISQRRAVERVAEVLFSNVLKLDDGAKNGRIN